MNSFCRECKNQSSAVCELPTRTERLLQSSGLVGAIAADALLGCVAVFNPAALRTNIVKYTGNQVDKIRERQASQEACARVHAALISEAVIEP